MKKKTRILLCEDDPNLGMLLKDYLIAKGFETELAVDGNEGLKMFRRSSFDFLILDVMMPQKDGFTLASEIRQDDKHTPILFLTAKSMKEDTLEGFKAGGDDYMTKPFRVRELLTRVKSHLRRAYGDLADAMGGRVIRAEDLVIDLERRKVTRGGARITLTPTEFEILRILAEKPGRVFARRDLLERVRDYDAAIAGDEKTINVHVSHLRDKVEPDPNKPRFVLTVRGVGYSFSDRSDRGERSGA